MKKALLLVVILISSVLFTACNPLDSKTKSGLQVITDDVSSSVFLNDEYLDKTPYINKKIKPGNYTIRIEPDDDNLTPYETTVTLNQGLLTVVTWKPGETPETSGGVIYELEKLQDKNKTEISFSTVPDNAILSFDDGEPDFSPLTLEDVTEGSHVFQVKLPSYSTQEHTINVIPGHRLLISVKMAKTGLGSEDDDQVIITDSDLTAEDEAEDTDETDVEQTDLAEEDSSEATEETDENESTTDEEEEETTNESDKKETSEASDTAETITIKSTNFFIEDEEVLRVRDKAGISGKELGFAPVGETYDYLGEKVNGWYKIDFEGEEGWISGTFADLSEE